MHIEPYRKGERPFRLSIRCLPWKLQRMLSLPITRVVSPRMGSFFRASKGLCCLTIAFPNESLGDRSVSHHLERSIEQVTTERYKGRQRDSLHCVVLPDWFIWLWHDIWDQLETLSLSLHSIRQPSAAASVVGRLISEWLVWENARVIVKRPSSYINFDSEVYVSYYY